jgi:DNA-binding response OmpR family regulator
MRMLVVEDEVDLNGVLCAALREAGYTADGAITGDDARELAERNAYDLIVLDLGLPDTDGRALCHEWRSRGNPAAILILTAQGRIADRVAGLDSGADDYLVKPFHVLELLARVRALTRSEGRVGPHAVALRVADLVLDPATHTVTRGNRRIALSYREFCILRYLMEHAGKVVTRPELMQRVWERPYEKENNLIDVYMGRLRQQLTDGREHPLLQTIRGTG